MEKRVILLVDDDADFVDMNRAVLENHGYEVHAAYNAEEGVRKSHEVKPDLIITSPAERALATAKIFAKELAYSIQDIQNKDLLYNSITPYGFINILRSIDDKVETVLLIGHNPTLSKFAAMLLPHFWHYLPKCGIVGIEFQKETWQEIGRHVEKHESAGFETRFQPTSRSASNTFITIN